MSPVKVGTDEGPAADVSKLVGAEVMGERYPESAVAPGSGGRGICMGRPGTL